MATLLLMLFTVGHCGLCVLVINRLHATALPFWLLKGCDALWYGFLVSMPIVFAASAFGPPPSGSVPAAVLHVYGWLAVAGGACGGVLWLIGRYRYSAEPLIVANHTQTIDMAQKLGRIPAGNWSTYILSRLPGNQVFQLAVHEKTLELAELPAALDGLSIVHLSDIHFTGRITREFYQVAVDQANRLQPDFVVISGDIIDKRCCLGWLTDVLGPLEANFGKYFVLGNHDLRLRNETVVRRSLESAGFVDLGGRWQLVTVRDWPIALGGNELPWFSPAAAAWEIPSQQGHRRVFRIAVSHSPDQIEWARAHRFDLMLAGHTHGGQIRFPCIGPVFSPSRFGVRFASGTFYCPPTLLHVSRGVSGTRPLRFACPPELTKLVLRPQTR